MTTKTLIKDIVLATTGVTAFTLLALFPVLTYAADSNLKSPQAVVQSINTKAELSGSFDGRSEHVTIGEVSIVETAAGYELILTDNFFLDGALDPVIGFGNGGTYDKATTFTTLKQKESRQTLRAYRKTSD